MEHQLKVIQIILGYVQIVDILIAAYLYKAYGKNKLYLYTFILWVGSFLSLTSDYAFGSTPGPRHVLFSSTWDLLCSFSIIQIMSMLFAISIPWKKILTINSILIFSSVVMCLLKVETFYMYSLPIVLAVTWPVIFVCLKSFKKASAINRFYIIITLTWAIHYLDYPFLRPLTDLEFSIFGFSFALLLTYLTSLLIPVVINQNIYSNMAEALNKKLAFKNAELESSKMSVLESEKRFATASASLSFVRNIKQYLKNISLSHKVRDDFYQKHHDPKKINPTYSEDLNHFHESIKTSQSSVESISKLIQSISKP